MVNPNEEKEENTNEEQGRKRSRKKARTAGSQTDDDENSNCSCQNMAATLNEINQKLDLALSKFAEIDDLKNKVKDLQEETNSLQESLTNAHQEIEDLKEHNKVQDKAIEELKKGVKDLTRDANSEKERVIKLESHSRRNNLNFFNIREEKEDSFAKTEAILRKFLTKELKAEDAEEISIERAHRIGKPRVDGKPRPIIAKFSFFKDKDYVLSLGSNLAGTKFGVAPDFPKEVVDIRKSLVPHLKAAKKSGRQAKLVYDKLYIDGQLFKQSTQGTSTDTSMV